MEGGLDGGPSRGRLQGLAGDVSLLLLNVRYNGAQPDHIPLGLLESAWAHEQHASQYGNHRQVHAYRKPELETMCTGVVLTLCGHFTRLGLV